MSNKIKLGFVGGGNDSLIGVLHKVAAVMFDRYHLVYLSESLNFWHK